MLQLFRFIDADLNSFRPKISSLDLPDDNVSGFAPEDDLHFPKSLYLIQPLSSYQLNPVAKVAQASVPVPEGLDLDAWIVHPPEDPVQDGPESTERKKRVKMARERVQAVKRKIARRSGKTMMAGCGVGFAGLPIAVAPLENDKRRREGAFAGSVMRVGKSAD